MKSFVRIFKSIVWFKPLFGLFICILLLIIPSCQEYEFYQDPILGVDELSTSALSKPDKDKIKIKYDKVKDIDGNKYLTVQIGTQTWMAENLKTTRFNDGTDIQMVTDNNAWINLTTPGYCWYKNDQASYGPTYGALYNWYTVDVESNDDRNVCPKGWHVPSYDEWIVLINYLGGMGVEGVGGKLKATGTLEGGDGLWHDPNLGATNETGFTALPSGYRSGILYEGVFGFINTITMWWSTTEFPINPNNVYSPQVASFISNVSNNLSDKEMGLCVRCIKD